MWQSGDGAPFSGDRVVHLAGGFGSRTSALTPDGVNAFVFGNDGEKSASAIHRAKGQPLVRARVVSFEEARVKVGD